ncbi:MAG TPA: hypothetical protein VMV87_03470 [Burkholderiales bacterium]|nr:hypothetical protein [Burkholderiales bacterium]
MAQNGTLSARQRRFVRCLLTARTVREAARQCRVGERTAWRWLKEPAVKVALAEINDGTLGQVSRAVSRLATSALDTLAAVMADKATPTGARVSAARSILDGALRLDEHLIVHDRLAELDRRIMKFEKMAAEWSRPGLPPQAADSEAEHEDKEAEER